MITTCNETQTIATSFRYDADFISDAKCISGRWNPGDKTWVFPLSQRDAVYGLVKEHYGYDPEDAATVTVTATAREFISHSNRALFFGARKICFVYGNRDDVKVGGGVKLVTGDIRNSCSRKRDCLGIDAGTTFRVIGFRKSALNKIDSSDWDVSVA